MLTGLTIAFDADDTLWHNEHAFAQAEGRFNDLVAPWATAQEAQAALVAHERTRVTTYGYGVKSFALSMIATAMELSGNQISAAELRTIIDTADELLAMPTVPIDGAIETLAQVSGAFPTMIITKGDLHHQMRRIDAAGVAEHCFDVEVVADKDVDTYRRILARHRIDPERFVMIGNSIVSDVAPLLELGARAIHIPYAVTWALETTAIEPEPSDRWFRVDSIRTVPELLEAF